MSGPEVRIDQLTGLRAILAPGRSSRPDDFSRGGARREESAAECPFCEGREERTPPELWAERPGGGDADTGGWRVRAVPNKFPALAPGGPSPPRDGRAEPGDAVDPLHPSTGRGDPDMFGGGPLHGAHEVIVHSPAHAETLCELVDDQLAAAVEGWRSRMRAHGDVACRHLIVNEGPDAGASLAHTHAQLYALPFVPAEIARERERFTAHHTRSMGGCLLCDLGAEEVRRRERLVAIDEEAMLLAPWASRSPFELRVVPRHHSPRFEDDGTVGTAMIGKALRLLAGKLGGPPQLNLWVRSAPSGAETFHWHVDIVPRLTIRAGFEMGTGVNINVYPPERAAADLRGDA